MATHDYRPSPPSLNVDADPSPSEYEPADSLPPVAPKRSKALIAVAAVVALLVVIGGVGATLFALYVRSPQYSLQQLQTAVETRDRTEFARYCDIEAVAEDLYDAGVDEVADRIGGDQLDSVASTIANLARPFALNLMKDQLSESIWAADTSGVEPDMRRVFLEASVSITKESATTAVATFTPVGGDVVYEFELGRVDDRWRITGLRNAGDVVADFGDDWLPAGELRLDQ